MDAAAILAQEVKSAFANVDTLIVLRRLYPSYGYTKTKIKDAMTRAEGMACAYEIVIGKHSYFNSVVIDTLDLDWTGLRKRIREVK